MRRHHKPWHKPALIVAAIIGLFVLAAYAYHHLREREAQAQQYAIYSAYLTQGLLQNAHELGSPTCQLSLLDHTVPRRAPFTPDALQNIPSQLRHELDLNTLHPHYFDATFDLPHPYKLISAKDEDYLDPDMGINEEERRIGCGGFITFTRIAFDRSLTTALFYTEHLHCGLCGGGAFILMQKKDGHWTIANQFGTWSS